MTSPTPRDKSYKVLKENGNTVFESDDIFDCMAKLKREPPGSCMIRSSDKKKLAYNSIARIDYDDPGHRKPKTIV